MAIRGKEAALGEKEVALRRIKEKFARKAPDYRNRLHQAFEAGDMLELAETVHYLASSAHAIQSSDLAASAKKLETLARSDRQSETADALKAFLEHLEAVLTTF
jgi:HPt (histidine-containing phosphotransfer) domain-containing protein